MGIAERLKSFLYGAVQISTLISPIFALLAILAVIAGNWEAFAVFIFLWINTALWTFEHERLKLGRKIAITIASMALLIFLGIALGFRSEVVAAAFFIGMLGLFIQVGLNFIIRKDFLKKAANFEKKAQETGLAAAILDSAFFIFFSAILIIFFAIPFLVAINASSNLPGTGPLSGVTLRFKGAELFDVTKLMSTESVKLTAAMLAPLFVPATGLSLGGWTTSSTNLVKYFYEKVGLPVALKVDGKVVNVDPRMQILAFSLIITVLIFGYYWIDFDQIKLKSVERWFSLARVLGKRLQKAKGAAGGKAGEESPEEILLRYSLGDVLEDFLEAIYAQAEWIDKLIRAQKENVDVAEIKAKLKVLKEYFTEERYWERLKKILMFLIVDTWVLLMDWWLPTLGIAGGALLFTALSWKVPLLFLVVVYVTSVAAVSMWRTIRFLARRLFSFVLMAFPTALQLLYMAMFMPERLALEGIGMLIALFFGIILLATFIYMGVLSWTSLVIVVGVIFFLVVLFTRTLDEFVKLAGNFILFYFLWRYVIYRMLSIDTGIIELEISKVAVYSLAVILYAALFDFFAKLFYLGTSILPLFLGKHLAKAVEFLLPTKKAAPMLFRTIPNLDKIIRDALAKGEKLEAYAMDRATSIIKLANGQYAIVSSKLINDKVFRKIDESFKITFKNIEGLEKVKVIYDKETGEVHVFHEGNKYSFSNLTKALEFWARKTGRTFGQLLRSMNIEVIKDGENVLDPEEIKKTAQVLNSTVGFLKDGRGFILKDDKGRLKAVISTPEGTWREVSFEELKKVTLRNIERLSRLVKSEKLIVKSGNRYKNVQEELERLHNAQSKEDYLKALKALENKINDDDRVIIGDREYTGKEFKSLLNITSEFLKGLDVGKFGGWPAFVDKIKTGKIKPEIVLKGLEGFSVLANNRAVVVKAKDGYRRVIKLKDPSDAIFKSNYLTALSELKSSINDDDRVIIGDREYTGKEFKSLLNITSEFLKGLDVGKFGGWPAFVDKIKETSEIITDPRQKAAFLAHELPTLAKFAPENADIAVKLGDRTEAHVFKGPDGSYRVATPEGVIKAESIQVLRRILESKLPVGVVETAEDKYSVFGLQELELEPLEDGRIKLQVTDVKTGKTAEFILPDRKTADELLKELNRGKIIDLETAATLKEITPSDMAKILKETPEGRLEAPNVEFKEFFEPKVLKNKKVLTKITGEGSFEKLLEDLSAKGGYWQGVIPGLGKVTVRGFGNGKVYVAFGGKEYLLDRGKTELLEKMEEFNITSGVQPQTLQSFKEVVEAISQKNPELGRSLVDEFANISEKITREEASSEEVLKFEKKLADAVKDLGIDLEKIDMPSGVKEALKDLQKVSERELKEYLEWKKMQDTLAKELPEAKTPDQIQISELDKSKVSVVTSPESGKTLKIEFNPEGKFKFKVFDQGREVFSAQQPLSTEEYLKHRDIIANSIQDKSLVGVLDKAALLKLKEISPEDLQKDYKLPRNIVESLKNVEKKDLNDSTMAEVVERAAELLSKSDLGKMYVKSDLNELPEPFIAEYIKNIDDEELTKVLERIQPEKLEKTLLLNLDKISLKDLDRIIKTAESSPVNVSSIIPKNIKKLKIDLNALKAIDEELFKLESIERNEPLEAESTKDIKKALVQFLSTPEENMGKEYQLADELLQQKRIFLNRPEGREKLRSFLQEKVRERYLPLIRSISKKDPELAAELMKKLAMVTPEAAREIKAIPTVKEEKLAGLHEKLWFPATEFLMDPNITLEAKLEFLKSLKENPELFSAILEKIRLDLIDKFVEELSKFLSEGRVPRKVAASELFEGIKNIKSLLSKEEDYVEFLKSLWEDLKEYKTKKEKPGKPVYANPATELKKALEELERDEKSSKELKEIIKDVKGVMEEKSGEKEAAIRKEKEKALSENTSTAENKEIRQ